MSRVPYVSLELAEPREIVTVLQGQMALWGRVVKAAGVTPE
jgi:hypothetical protein